MHVGDGANADALRAPGSPDRDRDILVLAADEARPLLDDRHRRAEASVHLRELEADVAAADDDEVASAAWSSASIVVLVRKGTRSHAGHVGHDRAAADVDEDARRRELLVADADGSSTTRTARVPGTPCSLARLRSPRSTPARAFDDTASARALTFVMSIRGGPVSTTPKSARAPGEMRRIGARDERLGRHAAGVDARAAEQLALDEGDRHARASSAGRPATDPPGPRR